MLRFQNGINADSTKYGKGIKYISVSDILNNQYITYDCIKGLIDIDEKTFNKFIVEYGDILFQRSSETFEDIGRANVYLDKEHSATFGGFVIRGKKISDYNPLFFRYLLCTHNARKQTVRMGAGAQHYNIGQEGLEKICLYFPCLQEQQKISDFLSAIDNKIAAQNKIISKYETLIKGISCDYFSKQPNHIAKLKDLIIKGKAGGTPSSTVAEYYNGDIPFLSISDMTKQGKYVEFTEKHISENGLANSSAWIVPSNSLILSMYASVGLVCINKVPLATSQAMFSMVLKDCNMLDYIYYYLNFFRETQIHRLLETGTQSNINADTVRDIEIPFYSNILVFVKTLQAIENRLNNEKDMLSRLMDLKTYLLSSLFILNRIIDTAVVACFNFFNCLSAAVLLLINQHK